VREVDTLPPTLGYSRRNADTMYCSSTRRMLTPYVTSPSLRMIDGRWCVVDVTRVTSAPPLIVQSPYSTECLVAVVNLELSGSVAPPCGLFDSFKQVCLLIFIVSVN